MSQLKGIFFVISLLFPVISYADNLENASPYEVLAEVGTSLFSKISNLTAEQRQNHDVMRNIVQQELMPYVDYRFASYKIMGRFVRTSTKQQRDAFVEAMYSYLVTTYADALSRYQHQKVVFEKNKPVGNKSIVSVRASIIDDEAPTIELNFKFRKNKRTGQWKAFDMIVEGVSLVSSKQAEISGLIRKVGIDSVINQLNNKALIQS